MKKCLQFFKFTLIWSLIFFIKSAPASNWPNKPSISRIMSPCKWRARSSHNSFWSSENDALLFRPSDVLPSISNRALEMASSVVLYWLTSYILGRIESSSRLTIFKVSSSVSGRGKIYSSIASWMVNNPSNKASGNSIFRNISSVVRSSVSSESFGSFSESSGCCFVIHIFVALVIYSRDKLFTEGNIFTNIREKHKWWV